MRVEKFESVALRMKRLDAYIVRLALKRASGLESPVNYEEIATALNDAGIKTRRGARFTARVARECVAELVDAGLIRLEKVDAGWFVRLVDVAEDEANVGAEDVAEDVAKDVAEDVAEDGANGDGAAPNIRRIRSVDETPACAGKVGGECEEGKGENDDPDFDGADLRFDGRTEERSEGKESDTDCGSERAPVFGSDCGSDCDSVFGSDSVGASTPLCINTKDKNKEINKTRAIGTRGRRARKETRTRAEAGSVEEAVAKVDVDDSDARAVRRKLVAVVWEPSLRRGLIDRAVAAFKLGFVSLADLMGFARRAADISGKSSRRIWQTFALDVKSLFDAKGFYWVPTSPGAEPKPDAARVCNAFAYDEEPEIFVKDNRTFVSFRRRRQ